MSFIYRRTITITRPGAQPDAVGYQGSAPSSQRSQETPIATGIKASIQQKGTGGKNSVGLPADNNLAIWHVFTKKHALADGQVQDNDIITDDLNRRFQVLADYTNSLGANFLVQRLEA